MKNILNKADEPTRRQFMQNAARAYLGVHLFPMLGQASPARLPKVLQKERKPST